MNCSTGPEAAAVSTRPSRSTASDSDNKKEVKAKMKFNLAWLFKSDRQETKEKEEKPVKPKSRAWELF